MAEEYYVIRKRAVPEVLLKVVRVNKLLASRAAKTVGEAVREVGISRSSYYKFKDEISEFHDSLEGKTLTLQLDIHDEAGVLSGNLSVIAVSRANILTIHQSIPTGGMAAVSISIQIREDTEDTGTILSALEQLNGVSRIRVTGRQEIS